MSPLSPALVVFDFDGTLADSFDWFCRTQARLAREYRFRSFDADDVDGWRSKSARELIRQSGVRWWQVPSVTRRARTLMREEVGSIAAFPGVDDALAVLRGKGVRLALVTSNSEDNVVRILGERTLSRFDQIACGAPLLGKARKLKQVVRTAGVPRERVLCIGDEIRDADVARDLGIRFRGVSWGYTLPAALQAHSAGPLFTTPAEWALL